MTPEIRPTKTTNGLLTHDCGNEVPPSSAPVTAQVLEPMLSCAALMWRL